MATAYDLNQQALMQRQQANSGRMIPVPGAMGGQAGGTTSPLGGNPATAGDLNQQALAQRQQANTGRSIPIPGGGYSQRQPRQYTPYRLPQGFRYSSPWGQSLARPEQFSMNNQQAQPQSNPAFDLLQMLGLGDFYTPHQLGQAQGVPNSGQQANFIGSYLPGSTVGGIQPGGYNLRTLPGQQN